VRGGYGIFYDAATLIENSALYFNPPYWTLSLWVPNPVPVTLANPFPAGRAIAPRPAVNTLDPRIRTPYAQQATAALEGVVKGTSFAARYVTSYGDDLTRKRNVNQAAPGPGPIDARRPFPTLGDVLLVESTASSTYHALQLTASRSGRAAVLRASYTLSTSMDDTSAFLASDGDDNTPQNSRDLAAEWGASSFDVRQRFVFTGSIATPAGGVPVLLRNWQASAVFTAQSGRPFTPRVSFDNSNTGNVGGGTFAYDRPNVVPVSSTSLPPPGARTYGGDTFVVAPQYTFGNAGRNSLVGPGYATLDAMISRRVQLSRRQQLSLRLELFNALNRKNLQLPDSFVDRVTFGQSLAAYAPRQLQLAARFTF
jgi:hypothetical protein